jgi:hypothetical protein
MAAGFVTAVLLMSPQANAASQAVNWQAVSQAIGHKLETEGHGVHTAKFPRSDLNVSAQGVQLDPHMELVAEALFKAIPDGKVLMLGEATLTNDQVQPMIAKLEQAGILVTALHKHLRDESPRLWWLHYEAIGDPVQIARALHDAYQSVGIPLKPESQEKQSHSQLDTARLDKIIGAHGEFHGRVYTYHVPYPQPITNTRAHIDLPPAMEASSLLMFQPIGDGKAAINGDFTMTADQVNPVIRALKSHGIQIVSLHNHLLFDQPRHFYMHFWATGDAADLARGLRAGLNAIQ